MMITSENRIINLNSLLDLTARLYESVDEYFILNSTLLSLMGKLKIIRGAVVKKNNDDKYIPLIIKGNLSFDNVSFIEPNDFTIIGDNFDIKGLDKSLLHSVIPIRKNIDESYAVILLGTGIINLDISPDEANYINLITTITANAITNARNFKSYKNEKNNVQRQNQLLTTLFEISKDFSKNFNPDQIIRTLALNLMGQLAVTRFAMFSINDKNTYSEIVNRFGHSLSAEELKYFSEIEYAQPVSCCNLPENSAELIKKLDIQIVAPMLVQGERRGLILIGKKLNGTEFTDENLLFIEALGNSAMLALENERLFREELEKKRLESELSIALEIQNNFLPSSCPALDSYDISGITIPSRHVGGDLYDFIDLGDGRYLIAIADVSGKGIPASLIMANFQAALRVLAMSELSLKEIIVKINKLLYRNTSADKFVTSFVAIIDDLSGKISYINCGHNPPYIRRKNLEIEPLTIGGLILGFMENPFEYEVGEVFLNSGEYLVCFTDGVTEASAPGGVDYGENRLECFIRDLNETKSDSILNKLVASVKEYLGESPQNDDITLIVACKN